MSAPITTLLRQQAFALLDGALATELERRGADLRDPLWSAKVLIEQPELIRAVHRDYLEAGADIVTTATYQASFVGFARRGIDYPAALQLMRDAVTLALQARDAYWNSAPHAGRVRPLVAASLGPYGAMLADGSEYRGDYSASDRELREFHAPRLAALLESGCDLFACETLPCLREALLLAQLLEEQRGICAWFSFSCADGEHNCAGEPIATCAAALSDFACVGALGVNCTRPQHIAPLLRHMRAASAKPLLAYPNSGERYDAVAKQWHESPDGSLADRAQSWIDAGAQLLGGCCRTTPADIAALHRLRQQLAGR